jgi:c-di-GMP-binding flagellar brake protein YcgR
MDTALQHIHEAIHGGLDDNGEDKRRKFKRFENKQMFVKFNLIENGKINKNKLFKGTIHDVSAGGMKIDIAESANLKSGDEIEFEISKENQASFLKGTGQLVRKEGSEATTSFGVRFLEVSH